MSPCARAFTSSTSMPQIGSSATPAVAAPAARIRLSESRRKFPEVTTVSPSMSPPRISTWSPRRRPVVTVPRYEDAGFLLHEDEPARAGVEHRPLRDEEGGADLDRKIDVHEHVGAKRRPGLRDFEAHLEGARRRVESRRNALLTTAAKHCAGPGLSHDCPRARERRGAPAPSKASASIQTRLEVGDRNRSIPGIE